MANLIVGDVHGCFNELILLLEKADYSPNSDHLWFVGDLVARGVQSLEVLRFISSNKNTKTVLGNHDLHLLSLYFSKQKGSKHDHLDDLLNAPDCDELIDWLCNQSFLLHEKTNNFLISHAGIPPNWDLEMTKSFNKKLSDAIKTNKNSEFYAKLYGNEPANYSPNLPEMDLLRYICNGFTRMRYCFPDHSLELTTKLPPKKIKFPLIPWFKFPLKIDTKKYKIAFGHWASLKGKCDQENIFALDTGCCWGEKLTLLNVEENKLIQKKKCN